MRDAGLSRTNWKRVWLARYALIYFIPAFIVFIAFAEDDKWYVILASFWALSTLFLAWRAADVDIGKWWKAGLLAGVLGFWGLTTIAVSAGPGPTTLCFTRYIKVHVWARPIPLEPYPACSGLRVG